jgi:hypothetical protein
VTCSWCEERFERFLENDLTPAEHAGLRDHLDRCDDCRSLLEELRVVDALLLQPRTIEPAPNFTFKTMADVRAMPPPRVPPSPLPALLVCYLVAVWALIGAGFVLEAPAMHAFTETALDLARTLVVASGGVLHVAAHLGDRGELSTWTTFAGGVMLADLILVATLIVAARSAAAPRAAQRQRW